MSIFPQDGAGGGTPRPKKLRPASDKMAEATPSVAETKSGEIALGRIWRNITRVGFAPSAVAASEKSVLFSFKNSARKSLAELGQDNTPKMIMVL